MTTVAIIPARGGSKGIPDKNIKSINGHPLIAWTINQALQAQGIDDVIVSTDSPKIARVAEEYGASVPFMRPGALASDTSTTEEAVVHSLKMLEDISGSIPDRVCLLQCTSPIRFPGTIDAALRICEAENADSVVGATELTAFTWKNFSHPTAEYDFTNRPRRQDILAEDRRFVENGSLYVTSSRAFLRSNCRISGRVALLAMSKIESYEIDEYDDWSIVENLMREQNLCI